MSKEGYKPTKEEMENAESIMTEKQKELSDARESGYVAHGEELKKKSDADIEESVRRIFQC